MTLAPPPELTDCAPGSPRSVATVTAVLVLRGPLTALPETLDGLARQTRSPDRLVVVDLGLDGEAVETVRSHAALAQAIPSVTWVTVPGSASIGYAVDAALAHDAETAAAQSDPRSECDHVWVLTCDTAAAPMALARLLDAVRRSPSVGVAGPKLVDWYQPGMLRSIGVQLTRSGRLVPLPAPGEPDQGQYDRRTDVLAVPTAGMLVERSLVESLRGHDRSLGEFGSEVDFAWRAQQAGHRVVVVPRATVRTGATLVGVDAGAGAGPGAPADAQVSVHLGGKPARGGSANRMRRQARRVALARCAWWALPFLAAWIAVSSVVSAVALLVAKRPRAAWAELSDLGAVLTPGRVLGARWRSRGTRRVRRRDLLGLFVPTRTVLRHTGDLIHDQVAFEVDADGAPVAGRQLAVESGPVADEAEDLNVLATTWVTRAARNPGLLAVLVTTVVAVLASRQMGGGILDRYHRGVAGGELIGLHATPGQLWHAWLDGWHGPGLGGTAEQGPHLVVLAGLAWVLQHLPLVGAEGTPAGSAVAVLVGLALPLATVSAYLAARAVTHAKLPRALAALAWSSTAVLTSALAVGRVGAAVAAILLPLAAAGYALAARRTGTVTVTAATVLVTAVLGAFVPALLVLAVAAGLLTVLLGPGWARLRGLALAAGPLVLLGPWVGTLLDQPWRLLAGPGLAVWGETQADPWQLALLHPGGPGSYPVLLSAPLVAAGLLGLLRAGTRGRAATVLAALALVGLAAGLAAPRVELGTVPVGFAHAGAPVTAWAGTGLMVMALALLAAALLGADGLPVRRSTGGWVALLRWPVGLAVVVAVVGALAWTSAATLGTTLHAWSDPRPAVAVDQADGTFANRMVLLDPEGDGLAYRLLGREVGDVARSLPPVEAPLPDSDAVGSAIGGLFEQGAAPGELHPARDLAQLAVGFVGLRADPSDPRIRTLDATAGLSRLGEHDGYLFWRVLPGGGTPGNDAVAPSRAQVVTTKSAQAVPVQGEHGRLHAKVTVPRDAMLTLAEPAGWIEHATVTVDGRTVSADGDTPAYPLPAGHHTLEVTVQPTHPTWLMAQGLALLVALFLALPFGTRASRRQA
jgi:GT2 family glycosyltransferase